MKRITMQMAVPGAVAAAVGGLLVFSAGRALWPVTEVTVSQVLFDREAYAIPTTTAAADPDQPSAPPRGKTVQAAGWLEPDPYMTACTALADGIVMEITALEGEAVEKGRAVARLIDDDAKLALAGAEAELAAAQSELLAAQAEHDAAQTDWDNPVERERAVAIWRASLAETEAQLAQLPALIESERATLAQLEYEHQRTRQAGEQGGASDLEVIVREKQVEMQAATVRALELREGILAAQRDRFEAEAAAAARNAQLRVSERRELATRSAAVERAGAAVLRAQARRDEARLRLDRMTIRAPISGRVARRLVAPGDKVMLQADDPHSAHLLHLYDPDKLQVRVDVPLAEAAHVFPGQSCEVVVDVLPDTAFEGEVTRITNRADIQKNTLEVKVRVIDPSPMLRPEMLTRVKFRPRAHKQGPGEAETAGTEKKSFVIVDERAFLRENTGESAAVWVVKDRRRDHGVAHLVRTNRVKSGKGWVSVTGDLNPGDLVVTPVRKLRDGQPVRMVAHSKQGGAS